MVSHFAPAKINLYLQVTGRRDDGYHLLDSLAVFAGFGDLVSAEPSESFTLSIDGEFSEGLGTGPDNLVMRAALGLQALVGKEALPGAALSLVKRLPVASGIGGGSADAAAALRALIDLFGLDPDEAALQALCLDLGADVPVCLNSRSTFMGGIGEDLSPVPALPQTHLVLVNPGVGVSTPAVFKARAAEGAEFSEPGRFDQPPEDAARLAALLAQRTNDLEPPARRLEPVIDDVLNVLAEQPACLLARMSGSGATCFGLFADETDALAAASRIGEDHADWWVVAAPILC